MSLCKDCVKGRAVFHFILSKYLISSGLTHKDDPKGMLSLLLPKFWQVVTITKVKWEKIGGVDSDVAIPSGDYPLNKAIRFLPDVFGPQLRNAQVRSSIDVAGRSCHLTQIIHCFSSSLTTLLLTASKLVALLLRPNHLIYIRFRPLSLMTSTVILSLQTLSAQEVISMSPIGSRTTPKKRHVLL